jgi:cholesterol transport system auxiliary component
MQTRRPAGKTPSPRELPTHVGAAPNVQTRFRKACWAAWGPSAYRAAAALALLGAVAQSGCALSSKGEAMTPRFFSPTALEAPDSAGALKLTAAPGTSDSAPAELRIGRVEPAAHIEERIAYRLSASELAYYDDRRWTEPPEQFVRRALERELFERRAFRRVVAGAAPTLDVEVLSFEELRQGAPRARLTLLISLRDERHALLERTLTVETPIRAGDDTGPALAGAMAVALESATEQIAAAVSAELLERSAGSIGAHEPRGAGASGAAAGGSGD